MKNTLTKRLISVFIIMIMLLSFVPTAFADWEDGRNCEGCGHYHWDEYMCGTCGYCSTECTDTDCCVSAHCNECGACFTEVVWCSDCMTCEDCYVNNGWHCLGCNDCYFTDEEALCGECWFCESCMGAFCDDCGFCLGCQELDGGVHCPECQNCYAPIGPCESDGDHCKECCLICEACDMCVFDEGLELCPECNLCELCCMENTQSEGCDCGEYCVEQSDWFEHICPDCGIPYCNVEKCELCGLCIDCCEGNSDCSDGMCVMDPEYDEHFCEDCGECTHNIDFCEICYDAGELRCEDCCDIVAEDEGCDCGDMCINDPDFYTHIAQEHFGADGSHAASPQSLWMFNENYHWHDCKYCDDAAHSKLGVNFHSYNNYNVCKICGFNKNDKILILKQPISRVCSVSDSNAETIDDPLYPYNNKVKFTVAAKGLSELSYQWYYSYGGQWFECKDTTDKIGNTTFVLSRGSKTNTFETDVPVDICYSTCYYKCVITDEDGNTVETVPASIRSRHIYKVSTFEKGTRIGDIYSDKTHFVTAYKSTGHYTECVGDGCEEYKIVPHNFEKEKTIVTCYYTKIEWIKSVCKDCGYEKYIKNHDHHFIDSETEQCDIDYTYENSINHKLACLFEDCDKTTLEKHTFMQWQNVGTPYNTQDNIGRPYKECYLCSYQYTKKPQRYDALQDKNVACDWTKQNDLVNVQFGSASSDIVYVGDKIIITFNPSVADKKDVIKMENPRCLNWNVYYYCDYGNGVIDKKVSEHFIASKIPGTASWEIEIPDFADRKGGGVFTFEPSIDSWECEHRSGTRISGAYDPVCIQDGYTGDEVCVDCGMVVKYGKIIEGGSEHEGELILNPLTVRVGSCEHRGYSGTSRCSVCKMAVRGESTPKVHTGEVTVYGYKPATCYEFGQTGDSYCECGAHLKSSRLIAPKHQNTTLVGYVAPTSSSDGYTGDTVCTDCDLVLKYGYVLSSDRLVSTIEIGGVTEPSAGDHPNYNATLLSSGVTIDRFSTLEINRGVDWKESNSLDYVYPHNVFRRRNNYVISVRVKTTDGNIFSGDVSATINGNEATVYVDPSYPDYATVSYTFQTSPAIPEELFITGIDRPVAGTNPDLTFEFDPYLYVVDEVYWTRVRDNVYISPDEVFEAGERYVIHIPLETNWDHGMDTVMFKEGIKTYINGILAAVEEIDDNYIQFCAEIPVNAYVRGKVSSVYDANDEVTMHLIPEGAPEPAYEFISKGNSFDYTFANVESGKYTLKVTKKNHKVYTTEIEVLGTDIVKDVTLIPETNVEISKEHQFDNACDSVCNLCGFTRIVEGHKFGDYVYNNDATEQKDGTKTRTCSVCDEKETVTAEGTKLEKTLVDSSQMFKDVPAKKWFKQYVDYSVTHGIFTGTSKDSFSPNSNITRAQFVQVLANLEGIDTSDRNVPTVFSDVPSGKWFTVAVKWASENNIVSGMGQGKFAPNANVTREQMCLMLTNYAKFKNITLTAVEAKENFADDAKISKWAKAAVYTCQQADIVNGKGAGLFDPQGTGTRAEASVIFTKFHKDYMK